MTTLYKALVAGASALVPSPADATQYATYAAALADLNAGNLRPDNLIRITADETRGGLPAWYLANVILDGLTLDFDFLTQSYSAAALTFLFVEPVSDKTEVDVGATFVPEASFTIADSRISATSKVMAQVLGISPSDGRDLDEIYVEQVQVFARPGAGSLQLDLQPKEGEFSGKFVVGYQVCPP